MFIVFVKFISAFNQTGSKTSSRGRRAMRRMACAALPTLVIAAPAHASDNAAADAKAEVIDGFELQNVDPLQFGRIVPSGLGGTVTINVNTGTVSTLGQVVAVGTDQTRARFTVKAPIGVIMVLAGDPTVELTRAGGTETMTASLTHRGTTGLATTAVFGLSIGLLAIAPDQEIHTGGSLAVPGNQVEGTYEGSFQLMVSYL